MTHYLCQPAVREDDGVSRGLHHHGIAGGLYAESEREFLAAQIARAVGCEGEIEIAVGELQGADDVAHV